MSHLIKAQWLDGWVKYTLTQARLNSIIFSFHSCRSPVNSKANNMGVDLDNILKTGCWSQQLKYTLIKVLPVCFPESNLINSQSLFIKSPRNSSGDASGKSYEV